jgi:hypothetical protein
MRSNNSGVTAYAPWSGAALGEVAERALAWVASETGAGRSSVLFVDQLDVYRSAPEALQTFYRPGQVQSIKGKWVGGGGPILAWLPTFDAFVEATRKAGAAICAVEHPDSPLSGWAIATRAIDLGTGGPTPDTRSPEIAELLDHLVFAGNNGWTDSPGKRDARRLLAELKSAGALDEGLVIGHVIASGASRIGVRQLETLLRQASRP